MKFITIITLWAVVWMLNTVFVVSAQKRIIGGDESLEGEFPYYGKCTHHIRPLGEKTTAIVFANHEIKKECSYESTIISCNQLHPPHPIISFHQRFLEWMWWNYDWT